MPLGQLLCTTLKTFDLYHNMYFFSFELQIPQQGTMECHFITAQLKTCKGSVMNLKECDKDITSHLANIHQSQGGISSEKALILSRVGVFGAAQNTTRKQNICQYHRDKLGVKFIAHRTCQHPGHNTRQAPEKGRSFPLSMSKEIYNLTSDLVQFGEGKHCYNFIGTLKKKFYQYAIPIDNIVKKEVGKKTANMYMIRFYIYFYGFINYAEQ